MNKRILALALAAALPFAGCARVQSRAAFKDGNKEYKAEDFKKAIAKERVA